MAKTETNMVELWTGDGRMDYAWSTPECYPEPSPTDIARNQFESMINQQKPHNIISSHDYIFYLSHTIDNRIHNNEPTPHKALFQLVGAKFGITEPATRVVPTTDLSTAYQYGLRLLESHEDIWMGTGSINDHSDPGGDQNLNPPLYKYIRTKEDLLDALQSANQFELEHPGSFLKIFPQDKEKPAIGSMVFSNNNLEGKWVHLKIRKGEYTTSERKSGDDKPIAISIDFNGPLIKIYTNQPTEETNRWLKIVLKSTDLFQKLDDIDLTGSNYLNPEFLIFLNGPDTKIAFFTDCIWGSKIKSQQGDRCPKTNPLLTKLSESILQEKVLIIPENRSQALVDLNTYQFTVLRTLESARSNNPDAQTAKLLIKTQENMGKLRLPFKIPTLDQITIKSLWRISQGYPLDSTINIIDYYRNQLMIEELPDPNIDYNKPMAIIDRTIRKYLPNVIYLNIKSYLQKLSKINSYKKNSDLRDFKRRFKPTKVSRRAMLAMVLADKAMEKEQTT